ncbi:MAG TPA: pyroglutamyl-peptidase I [Candidatus Obscuribacterales bacterium]
MRCLITGFEPFGSEKSNPSQDVVKMLPSQLGRGTKAADVAGKVLTTCGSCAWRELARPLSKSDVVIMLGLASGRKKIGLERFALNIRDYPLPDNKGHKPQNRPIDPACPLALKTDIDVRLLAKKLNDLGLPSEVSNHAGSFVCNETYFRALRHQADNGKPGAVLFVHLPRAGSLCYTAYGARMAKGMSPAVRRQAGLRIMSEAIIAIAESLIARQSRNRSR